jgi:hypothetical protein
MQMRTWEKQTKDSFALVEMESFKLFCEWLKYIR